MKNQKEDQRIEEFREAYFELIRLAAESNSEISAQTIRSQYPTKLTSPPIKGILPPIFKQAVKENVLKPTKKYTLSKAHNTPIRVYKSLIFISSSRRPSPKPDKIDKEVD